MNTIVHLNIHYPIERRATAGRRRDCSAKVEERRKANAERPTFLTTDHNTHGAFKSGFRKLGGAGLDFIGVNLPKDHHLEIRNHKRVDGTIDGHDFWGVLCDLAFPEGEHSRFWLVQANLGRGEPAKVFAENVRRIKAAFPGPAILGLDEIDEADRPDEHEILGDLFPRIEDDQIAGWGTTSPTLVRGARKLEVVRPRVLLACPGLAGYTPHRPLVETRIRAR